MILARDPQKSIEKIKAAPTIYATPKNGTIVCRDCGCEVVRRSTHLECECRIGLVAQWDQSLGGGFYLGRIVDPLEVKP